MPLEIEDKFVMRPGTGYETLLVLPGLQVVGDTLIEQVYLQGGARIRFIGEPDGPEPERYVFTYKQRVPAGQVEIETPISGYDYHLLAPTSDRRIQKTRTIFHHGETGLKVELDQFYGPDREIFLTMAEIEHDGGERLEAVAALLAPHVHLRVPRDDHRWDNSKLADLSYALDLIASVGLPVVRPALHGA